MTRLLDWTNSTSLHRLPLAREHQEPHLLDLEEVIEYAAQMLPAEGPITGFSFLNPLHAFEHMPFEEAVKVGLHLIGGQPYLSEDRYREEVKRDRIRTVDLQAVVEEDLGKRGWETIAGLCSRISLRMAMLQNRIVSGTPGVVQWHMAETEALTKFRSDIPRQHRDRIFTSTFRWVVRDIINNGSVDGGYQPPGANDARRLHVLWPLLERFGDVAKIDPGRDASQWSDASWEAFTVQALWRICQSGIAEAEHHVEPPPLKVRPREVLLQATGLDSDTLVQEVMIRYCAAFADQGYANWPLECRELGFYKAFLRVYRSPGGPPHHWMRGLDRELARLDDAGISPLQSIHESLELLGISSGEWEDFFPRTVLAMRGWASMIRQMDVRGDRFPVPAPRGTLTDFLAVYLILERFAVAEVAHEGLSYRGPLKGVREEALKRVKFSEPDLDQRTYMLFQLAQIQGWTPVDLHALTEAQWGTLVAEVEAFTNLERRRIFQLAFERQYQIGALDALSLHTRRQPKLRPTPRFQACFCIDAREESFRRHLEETCPDMETFGAAGFFSVPIYFRGAAEANFVPLCPVIMQPKHWMSEEAVIPLQEMHRRRAQSRRLVGTASREFEVGSRSFAVGALLTAGLGVLASLPLVARVLFPRLTGQLERTANSFFDPPSITRLIVERTAEQPGPEQGQQGLTLEEMATVGERVLRDLGLTSNFGRLFFFVAHRSACLNNPHKSAYDCGACTGPGGPNGRALCIILNDLRVRKIIAERGLHIPEDTWFVAGYHNTALDSVVFYDLDLLPRTHLKEFEFAMEVFETACERNAHERCRRFDSAPLNISLADARRHVENRAEDLAQVRPEFGNATNALCVVGRRERTRGLYMDRRCFLHSYDATQDDEDGTILARILSAVVPVCQGINLQYYFSSVDSPGWACGSKLPHNVTSLLGVMDGAASDLRPGLPWQGVEIHEPLRLMFVIETTPEVMFKVLKHDSTIDRIIRNHWSHLALLSPHSNELRVFRDGEFHLYHPDNLSLSQVRASTDWYRGSRSNLAFAQIEPSNN
ncbi:MAG TPA: DUF2309 domain-containing protein [Gemmataceae bacterium]|nr:DUF2309 domain-containing protein [Gemmataceae bacterium]